MFASESSHYRREEPMLLRRSGEEGEKTRKWGARARARGGKGGGGETRQQG